MEADLLQTHLTATHSQAENRVKQGGNGNSRKVEKVKVYIY